MANLRGSDAGLAKLRLPLAMMILVALLAFELSFDWSRYATPADGLRQSAAAADPAARIIDLLGPEPVYDAFLAAPVLDPERSPILLPSSGTSEASESGEIRLLGTVVAGEGRVALFRVQGETELIRAGPGDLVGDWQVTDLRARTVRLERSGESLQLVLPDHENGGQ